jgi:hypothetical protein
MFAGIWLKISFTAAAVSDIVVSSSPESGVEVTRNGVVWSFDLVAAAMVALLHVNLIFYARLPGLSIN